jgi:hypothetical protein
MSMQMSIVVDEELRVEESSVCSGEASGRGVRASAVRPSNCRAE